MRAEDLLHTHAVHIQDTALVSLEGELDLATAPLAVHAVTQALADHPPHLELDVVGLSFCDAAGLRALLAARRTARLQGTDFRLIGVNPRLQHTITLLRATDLLPQTPV